METRQRQQFNRPYQTERDQPIRLKPQPGEIWAALVDDQPIAYGKTLKEAHKRALDLHPDVEPVMDLITWLWDVGFFEGPNGEDRIERAVWIPGL